MAGSVKTEEFSRSSHFSRWLRQRLKAVIIPRTDPENRHVFLEHFDDSSRNAEIAVEGLARLFKNHPLKSAWVLVAIYDWLTRYFGAQKYLADKPRYLIYTEHDDRIPFKPEADILYTYMLSQTAYIANEMADITTLQQSRHIVKGFMEMNILGAEAFRAYPTVMPRFLRHKRLSLKVIQYLDRPLNCCPSLHIAYSLFLDGVAEMLLSPFKEKKAAFDSVRYSTIGMFNSVLYTKQHSILDVAFGMICAEMVFERWFDRDFNNFISVFPTLAQKHAIPYDEIVSIYEEASRIRQRTGSLAQTLGAYLERHGYPTIGPDESIGISYFDTRTRAVAVKEE